MSSKLLSAAVRSIRSTADYMTSLGNRLEASADPREVVAVSDMLETEIERMRVMVLLLRHDAQSSVQPDPAPKAVAFAPVPTQPPTRTVIPCQQPRTCNCGQGFVHHRHAANGEFLCNYCSGFVGYCGENGCDFGIAHNCRWSRAEQPTPGAL